MNNALESITDDFNKALNRLSEALELAPTRIHKDATIQRFEFCFELSWKTIKLFLNNQGIECKSPRDCFRRAADYGLIDNPARWFDFLDARNLIAHTYNIKTADKIYKKAAIFRKNAQKLLNELKEQ
ncbi:nucleotidyltransferase [Patescibacteria group bacterium]|nr:MAG: nucleotidyltransferase [Patescibacteria group bacterium]